MCECVKTCVRVNGAYTKYFDCPVRLKQGCMPSPVIFSIFVNKLTKLIENSDIRRIQLFPDIKELLLSLFTDDVALISDTIKGLQSQLKILHKFCEIYKMIVNVIKTKIMVFRLGGRLRANEKFFYNASKLEIVNGFQYVGLLLTPTQSMYMMTGNLSKKPKEYLCWCCKPE